MHEFVTIQWFRDNVASSDYLTVPLPWGGQHAVQRWGHNQVRPNAQITSQYHTPKYLTKKISQNTVSMKNPTQYNLHTKHYKLKRDAIIPQFEDFLKLL